jgi:hypothetical protein
VFAMSAPHSGEGSGSSCEIVSAFMTLRLLVSTCSNQKQKREVGKAQALRPLELTISVHRMHDIASPL